MGGYGETLFYDPYDIEKISFTSVYKPGRIILFDDLYLMLLDPNP